MSQEYETFHPAVDQFFDGFKVFSGMIRKGDQIRAVTVILQPVQQTDDQSLEMFFLRGPARAQQDGRGMGLVAAEELVAEILLVAEFMREIENPPPGFFRTEIVGSAVQNLGNRRLRQSRSFGYDFQGSGHFFYLEFMKTKFTYEIFVWE